MLQFLLKTDVPEHFNLSRAIKEEKYAARRAIVPVLQAEEDERYTNCFLHISIIICKIGKKVYCARH